MVTVSNFNEEQYAATTDTRCIKVYIPDDDSYVPLLGGLLALAGIPENYLNADTVQAEGVADIWKTAYLQTDWGGCGTPPECEHVDSAIVIPATSLTVLTGNAAPPVIVASQILNFACFQNTPASGTDELRTFRYMAAGVWDYRITGFKTNVSGRHNFQIVEGDGTILSVATLDYYAAATTLNAVFTGTFTMVSSGKTQIYFGADGKNASSGGFRRDMTLIELWRTAD